GNENPRPRPTGFPGRFLRVQANCESVAQFSARPWGIPRGARRLPPLRGRAAFVTARRVKHRTGWLFACSSRPTPPEHSLVLVKWPPDEVATHPGPRAKGARRLEMRRKLRPLLRWQPLVGVLMLAGLLAANVNVASAHQWGSYHWDKSGSQI